jgi:type I restriction enzyme M protein
MSVTNSNNTASIGFEQQIWEAADILRGNMDAAEYKHVVLGLIFLKYISDKFEERYRENIWNPALHHSIHPLLWLL